MYCKNCGNPIDPNAAVCLNCGVAKGTGISYCANCGQPVASGAAVCTTCSFATTQGSVPNPNAKSKLVAGLLGILLGGLGIHNFYLGYTGKAIAQVLLGTVGCCIGVGPLVSGIWGLVEGIMILCGNIKTDAKGVPLKD
jgi:TM2 domain-containing membrane protein YozV